MKTALVIGGCKSGKTHHALERALAWGLPEKIYLATCVPQDREMRERIRLHRQERGSGWTTVEEPLDPERALAKLAGPDAVVVLDCLTLWINNLLLERMEDAALCRRFSSLATALIHASGPVIVVSNEVGTGIVPENPLARRFRDLAGLANQTVAGAVDQVLWMVAGIPLTVKGAVVASCPQERAHGRT